MTKESHRHFHDELAELRQRLLTMSGVAESAVALAVEALLEHDAERAARVLAGDNDLDRREVDIEERCVALIALHQPMARDLRMLLAVLKLTNALERVGDHAVNIAEAAKRVTDAAAVNGASGAGTPVRAAMPDAELAEAARLTRAMLSDAIDAFIRDDAPAARAIRRRDDAVDALNRTIVGGVIAGMAQDTGTIPTGMDIVLVSRNLERIADLATNIAEEVVYLVEGKSIKHRSENGAA